MINTQHAENRAEAFRAIEQLQNFLNDCDFEGNAVEEGASLDRKWRELRDNKYRVVFLGAFNVGKSALINAFLGDEYLPTVLEECTTKITQIVKSDRMQTTLVLSVPASDDEFDALSRLIEACNMNATVERAEEGDDLIIYYASSSSKDLLKSLRPLVTLSADEDFPVLKSLRNKFDEIYLHLPSSLLEDDIALVDSPGVHSIAETNLKIAHEIIPDSHLVVCMIESQSAGNEQNRDFIEQIAKHKHRKVLFVINKCDQLNKDEMDPLGRRGPAKDLLRSLEGIIDGPEIFFVSALYALVSAQLSNDRLQLTDIEHNNKIKIPWSAQSELLQSGDPAKGVASYLMTHSNFVNFKNRLLDYLYKENREGAILESVCRFISTRAWGFARPLQVKLDLVRDNPRLDELVRIRENLTRQLANLQAGCQNIQDMYQAMTSGGSWDGVAYTGYDSLITNAFSEKAIEEQIMKPLRQWLASSDNISKARHASYVPLASELQRVIDAKTQQTIAGIRNEAQAVRLRILAAMGPLANDVQSDPDDCAAASCGPVGAIQAGMAGSYFGFLIAGAVAGGAAGWFGWNMLAARPDILQTITNALQGCPCIDMRLGAAVGAVAGGLLGLIIRAATSSGVRREKLTGIVREKVGQLLLQGGTSETGTAFTSVCDQLRDAAARHQAAFAESIRMTCDKAVADLSQRIETLQAEEEEIRLRQLEVIQRLEPKLQDLTELGKRAHDIAEANALRDTAPGVNVIANTIEVPDDEPAFDRTETFDE